MLRLILFLAVIIVLAIGFSWLADRPGEILVNWQGYRWDTNVFDVTILLAGLVLFSLVAWSALRHIWESPASVGRFFKRRRQTRGLDALSSGMIAIGAGDRDGALRYAIQARKSMPNEPLTHLLRAQAAQITGDNATSRRIFEAMLSSPDTEQMGLRGLYLEAVREGEEEAAIQFADRALNLNPKLEWSSESLFKLQCKRGDWPGALKTLAIARRNGSMEKAAADRARAVLLTAQAQAAEDTDTEMALTLALEAHGLAPDLIPAAAIAGRLLASRSNTPRAARIIQKTWKVAPHPDLAVAYAYARLGDSPRDRLERVGKLAASNPHSIESPIALATAAIEAKDFGRARLALKPLLESRLTQRVCTLMARIESEAHGNRGRVREWLARAVNAPRDPAWTADGVVSETWAAVSPVSGSLDAFQWRVPIESADTTSKEILASRLDELVALGAPGDFSNEPAPTPADQPKPAGHGEHDARNDMVDVSPARDHSDAHHPTPGADSHNTESHPDDEQPDDEPRPAIATRRPTRKKTSKSKRGSNRNRVRADDAPSDGGNISSTRTHDNEKAAVSRKPDAASNAGAKTGSTRRSDQRSISEADQDDTTQRAEAVDDAASANRTVSADHEARSSSKGQSQRKSGSRGKKRRQGKKTEHDETKVFVSPRAPDDPGPEGSSTMGDSTGTATPFRRRYPS